MKRGGVLLFIQPSHFLGGQVCIACAFLNPWYAFNVWFCLIPGLFFLRGWGLGNFILGAFWQDYWTRDSEVLLCHSFFWFNCSASPLLDPLPRFFQGGQLDLLAGRLVHHIQTIYLDWDPHWGSWFLGFALGEGLSDNWHTLYRELGLLHVLVVSGSHFSFLGMIFQGVIEGAGRILYSLRIIGLGFWMGWITAARFLVSLIMTLFALMVGFNPPCQRAWLAILFKLWLPLLGAPCPDRQQDRWIFCLQALLFPHSFLSLSNALSWSAFALIRVLKPWPKKWQSLLLPGIEGPMITVNLSYFGVFSPFGILLSPILQSLWNVLLGWGLLVLLWPESFLGECLLIFLEHLHTLLLAVHQFQANAGGPVLGEGEDWWGQAMRTLLWCMASWTFLSLWRHDSIRDEAC